MSAHYPSNLEPIAIIGIGCRFPGGANDRHSYWDLLARGKDAISETPEDRWSLQKFYVPGGAKPGKTQSKWGGYVTGIDHFDPQLFGISPREAASMDPQQRMLLEVTWRALEDGGQPIERMAGENVSVFVGISSIDYSVAGLSFQDRGIIHPYSNTGGSSSIAANRISYCFDFRGPSVAVDTACSSSLVAVHMACESLWHGDSHMALAGGVNALLLPDFYVAFSQLGVLSPDGRCKAFDERANGYVRSEGAGMVLLKPLSRALADGDTIYAVVRSTGLNQDGRTPGLTVPSQEAQESLIRSTCARAGISPSDLQYIEAHGTGTNVGDPIEANAIGSAVGSRRPRKEPCWIGSVKTNIGHLEAGAGIASLIKVALSLHHETIPAHLHFQRPNPSIDFERLGLRIPVQPQPWKSTSQSRLAGVNGFGYGGANAHVILEQAPTQDLNRKIFSDRHRSDRNEANSAHQPVFFPFSSRSAQGISSVAQTLTDWLQENQKEYTLHEMASVLAFKRSHLEHRAFVCGETQEEFKEQLQEMVVGNARATWRALPASKRSLGYAFVFSGQGPQWWAMGRPLMTQSESFRGAIEACDREFLKYGSWSLIEELHRDQASSRMNQTSFAQPSIFALQVALSAMWADWGIRPAAIVGHSVGEIAAAHLSGALNFQDACRVAFHRGRTMELATSKGRMLAVGLGVDELKNWIDLDSDAISIAAMNGPTSLTLSGQAEAIEDLAKQLDAAGIFARFLAVEYAFHSSQMEPVRDELLRSLEGIRPRSTDTQLISTVTGRTIDGAELNGEYWWKNVRMAVRFSDAMNVLCDAGFGAIVEVGPHPVLSFSMTECFQASNQSVQVLPSLHRESNDIRCMMESLGGLYSLGFDIDWERIQREHPSSISLPVYPFQTQKCWAESRESRRTRLETNIHPIFGEPQHGPQASWQGRVDLRLQTYLTDHRVKGVCLLPAAAVIEGALAKAQELNQSQEVMIERVRLHNPCILSEDRPQWIQSSYRPDRRLLELSFRECEEDTWSSLATIGLNSDRTVDRFPAISLNEVRERAEETFDGNRCYEYCRRIGLEYGPLFRGVVSGWRRKGEALALVELPKELKEEAEGYVIHPALLDSCFHAMIAADPDFHRTLSSRFLPVEVREVRFFQKPSEKLQVHVRLLYKTSKHMLCDVDLYDVDGTPCMSLRGFLSQRVTGGKQDENYRDLTYNYVWEKEDLESNVAALVGVEASQLASREKRNWIVFSDRVLGPKVIERLRSHGDRVCSVVHGERFENSKKESFIIDPSNRGDFAKVLAAQPEPVSDLLFLWALDTPDATSLTTDNLDESTLLTTLAPMHLIQSWDSKDDRSTARLCIVTARGQSMDGRPESVAIAQTPLIGFGRVIVSEYARLKTRLVDLSDATASIGLEELMGEIDRLDDEDEVLYRQGNRHVHRFHSDYDQPVSTEAHDSLPYQLSLGKSSGISELQYRTKAELELKPHEVEIEVVAVGLNFSDVMKALDLYPGLIGTQVDLGAECSGRISRVGSKVENWKVGDEVIAVAPGAFSSHVSVHHELVARKPKNLTHEQAAAVPIAFLTAIYALEECARLQQGESVLIHSATGGVGMAAIQLARNIGASLFLTAGNDEKRSYLQSLLSRNSREEDARKEGEIPNLLHRIMDSRTLHFAEEIAQETNGRGVDVVLNSLPGEAISKGMASLNLGGRFLEIGKRDIYGDAPLGLYPFRNNLSFFAIDLDQMFKLRPERMGKMLRDLVERFERGELQPLPTLCYPIDETANAFRLMQQGKHIGKVVVQMEERPQQVMPGDHAPLSLSQDSTYWIAGGLGGFGLEIAKWLVDRGARYLVLSGRSLSLSEDAKAAIASMEKLGAKVQCIPADITRKSEIEHVLGRIEAEMPKLRGVFHTAMVLEDRLLVDLDRATLDRVLRPKVLGGWNLHECTRNYPLDHFVLFSSLSSVFGHAGQANYSAANALLDGLAYYRRAQGLPALVMNWGHLGETGYLAKRKQLGDRLERQGVLSFTVKQALECLEYGLQLKQVQLSVLKIDWSIWRGLGITTRMSPRFAHLVRSTGSNQAGSGQATVDADALRNISPADRIPIIQGAILGKASSLLGIPESELDLEVALLELGLDSLMAVEMRNWIEGQLEVNLPISVLMRGATVRQLTVTISEEFASKSNRDSQVSNAASEGELLDVTADQAVSLLEQLPSMSDQDVSVLLSKMLNEQGKK